MGYTPGYTPDGLRAYARSARCGGELHGKACSKRSARVSPGIRQGIPPKRCWDCWDWVPGRPASERAVAKFIACLPCLPQTIHLRPTSCTKGYTPRYTPVYAEVYPGQESTYQYCCSLEACIGRPTADLRRNGCLLQDLMARRAPGDPPEDARVYAWAYPQAVLGLSFGAACIRARCGETHRIRTNRRWPTSRMARRALGDSPGYPRVYVRLYPQSGTGTAGIGFRGGLHPSAQRQNS